MQNSDLKRTIGTYVYGIANTSISVKDDKEEYRLNLKLFELESYLVKLRNDLQVNTRLDTTITSSNILQNFRDPSHENALKPLDFQFTFLHHLIKNYNPYVQVYELIDSYIEVWKNSFTVADIVITKTGATRCKTNLRFALNGLRDLGLVVNTEENGKRSWAPSLEGVLLMSYAMESGHFQLRFQKLEKRSLSGVQLQSINPRGRTDPTGKIDPDLITLINEYRYPRDKNGLLDFPETLGMSKPRETLKRISNDFFDTIENCRNIGCTSKVSGKFEKIATRIANQIGNTKIDQEKCMPVIIDNYKTLSAEFKY